MQNFLESVVNTFKQRVESGAVQKVIEDQVDKFVKDNISSILASYSDFSKALKEKMENELISNLDRLSLEQYNSLILGMVKKKLDDEYINIARERVEGSLKELFQKPNITKFSQLIEMFKKDWEDEAREEEYECATLHVEDRDHIVFVYFDYKPDVRDYSCRHRWVVHIDRENKKLGRLVSAQDYDSDSKKLKTIDASLSRMGQLDSVLFHLIAYGVPLELDFKEAKYKLDYNWMG